MTATELLTEIASAAKEKKISGYALAKITRLDARHVYRILNNEHSPSLDTVLKLCEAVGIELEIFNLGKMPAKTKDMKVILDFFQNGQLSYYTSLAATKAANPSCNEQQCGAAVLAEMREKYPDDEETLAIAGWIF
jgi:transcriptional regulator with XRE-family HTH domain